MRISKPLNKFVIILFLLVFENNISLSNEPADIWKIEKIKNLETLNSQEEKNNSEDLIQEIKIEEQSESIIVNKKLDSSEVKLVGLYDPSENGLSIDMWSNSDGKQIKDILEKIKIKDLSNISKSILDIAKLSSIRNIFVKLILFVLLVFFAIILLSKIDFPAPNKKIEKIIPNENFKAVK